MNRKGFVKLGLPALLFLIVMSVLILFIMPAFSTPTLTDNILVTNNDTQYLTGKNFGFQINITDDECGFLCISNATFETNITTGGAVANITKADIAKYTTFTNDTHGMWWINFTQEQTKGAGTYVFKWYANNTTSDWNASNEEVFKILQNTTPTLSLSITPPNSTTYPSTVTAVGSFIGDAGANISLYRNGTIVSSSVTSNSILETILLGAKTYNYTLVYNGTQNYTFASLTNITIVNQNSTNPVLLSINNGTTYDNQNVIITYGTPITVNCSNAYPISGSCLLYRDGLSIGSDTETNVLSGGTHTYIANTSGNANYSLNQSGAVFQVIVNTASNPVNLYLNGTGNKTYTYPQGINATATSAGGTVYLYRNNIPIVNGSSPQSEQVLLGNGTGTYAYYVNATGNANYSDNNTGIVYYAFVDKGTPNAVIYINEAQTNDTVTYPTSVTIKGNSSTTVTPPTFNLYVGSVSLGAGSSVSQSVVMSAGTHRVNFSTDGNENWTSASNSTIFLIVSPNSSNPVKLTINNGTILDDQNASITYGISITANCSNLYSDSGSCLLYRDAVSIGSNSETVTLGAGIHNYTATTSGNTNYSANTSGETFYVNVSKGTPNAKVFINENPSNTTINYSSALTIKGNSSSGGVLPALFNISIMNVTTASQSISISNTSQSSPIFLSPSIGNGTYRINLTYDGNSNWSSTSNSTIYLFVNKGTASLNVYIDGNASNETITYPSTANITGNTSNSGDSDCIYILWKNNTQLINSTQAGISTLWNYTQLGNGTYGPFKYNMSGTCSNWTLGSSSSYYLFVNKGILLGSITGSSVTYPASVNVIPSQSNIGGDDVNYTFWRNGALISFSSALGQSPSADTSQISAATYTYLLNTTGDTFTNWSSNSSIATLSITVSAASSSNTGGSSIGGISTTGMVTYINLAVGKANITANYLTTDGKLIASIARYQDVAFRGINITVVNNVANIKIMSSKLANLPSSVPYDINGKVYNYISVDKLNITDADIKLVNIKFAVNKTWLTNNNIDASNITLYRWANNKWNDLNAVKVSDDGKEVFFTVSSPGLSIFIIGTKGGAPIIPETPATCTESWSCADWSTCANSQQTRTCTDANSCGTTTNKPSESQSCTVSKGETTVPSSSPVPTSILTTIIVIVIAIIACVFIFLERTNMSSYLKKYSKKSNNNHKNLDILARKANKIEEEEEEMSSIRAD